MKRYLLITSDDFGVTHSVNQGILKGFTNGVLQSSNFMATTPWFPEAVKITKDNNLPIGVHLTLTCEWTNMKHSPITGAKSLTDDMGYFYPHYDKLFKTIDFNDVKNEYRAQINRVIKAGIQPTHVETHMLEPMVHSGYPDIYKELQKAIVEVADEFGLIYTYHTEDTKLKYFGQTLELTQKSYSQITQQLKELPEGIHHLICHCGLDNEEQRNLANPNETVYVWGGKARQQDLDIITSSRFKNFLKEENFELINVKELVKLLVKQ